MNRRFSGRWGKEAVIKSWFFFLSAYRGKDLAKYKRFGTSLYAMLIQDYCIVIGALLGEYLHFRKTSNRAESRLEGFLLEKWRSRHRKRIWV